MSDRVVLNPVPSRFGDAVAEIWIVILSYPYPVAQPAGEQPTYRGAQGSRIQWSLPRYLSTWCSLRLQEDPFHINCDMSQSFVILTPIPKIKEQLADSTSTCGLSSQNDAAIAGHCKRNKKKVAGDKVLRCHDAPNQALFVCIIRVREMREKQMHFLVLHLWSIFIRPVEMLNYFVDIYAIDPLSFSWDT